MRMLVGGPGMRDRGRRRSVWMGVAALLAVLVMGIAAPTSGASSKGTSAKVVVVVKRGTFGQILATTGARMTLYYQAVGNVPGACLGAWPPLLMPAGKTMPTGATGLGTKAFQKTKLQVTYKGKRLYTFAGDSGHSVNGNGVSGFYVAQLTG